MKGLGLIAVLIALWMAGCHRVEDETVTPPSLWIESGNWSLSSIPADSSLDSLRGTLSWWNPAGTRQVLVRDVWPDSLVDSQVANTVQSLTLDFEPDSGGGRTEHSWAGVIRYLGDSYVNQSRTQFFKFWVRLPSNLNISMQPNARLVIDLGTISEDAIPNDSMNSEDRPMPGQVANNPLREYGNGKLDSGEDTGLDGIAGNDPLDSTSWNGTTRAVKPSWDDWAYSPGSDYYGRFNGTENNGRLDTEDLNGDNFLNRENSYFSYSVALYRDNPYVVEGRDNPHGWLHFYLPIQNANPNLRRTVGNADLTAIRWARLYVTGLTQRTQLEFVEMGLSTEL